MRILYFYVQHMEEPYVPRTHDSREFKAGAIAGDLVLVQVAAQRHADLWLHCQKQETENGDGFTAEFKQDATLERRGN